MGCEKVRLIINDSVSEFFDKISSILFLKHEEFFKDYTTKLGIKLDNEYFVLLDDLKRIKELDSEFLNFYFGSFCDYKDVRNANIFCLATTFFKIPQIYTKDFFEIIDYLSAVTEEEIRKNILESLIYLQGDLKTETSTQQYLNDRESLFELLNNLNIKPEYKWIIFKVMKSPKTYVDQFCNKLMLVNGYLNEAIYNLIKFRDEWMNQLKNINMDFPKKIISTLKGKEYLSCNYINIYPTLLPYTATITKSEDNIYVGLGYKVDEIFENTLEKAEINHIIDFLKLLSDKSKFKILILLSHKKMYANEIAEQLNLTNATISHHMRILTLQGLVESTRNQNKTYYYLNSSKFDSLLNGLLKKFKAVPGLDGDE
ncbi:metalloregulator ArsR/SmtB family transcription factor [Bacillus velezensis]|nr:metalloregulator ArsR/SmtB family transcription factor [Bacillus velezensis]MED3333527.1 metalloregulator ArsR/SmtB family transcription factor [Bacillus velezensis]MED3677156.1 metalloregulator ArsR/SmtB family transcription factor [Bacillus velezensis]USY31941.1 metalloregulator ArsR/SmtB family transcription factor [Bacillus velezensis]WRT03568.1 metalloregulator ArsR/SmtB family transcription factor [Bacillus velezensis]WRT10893.1 metalloregulator ArsR/SmtB family transcription factor [